MRDCLNNDKTVIYHVGGKLNYTLNPAHKFQYLLQGDDKIQNSRGASATTAEGSDQPPVQRLLARHSRSRRTR